MADRDSYGLGHRLDIEQLLLEAQHRWLRPAEICEILRNYQKFHIASEPPTRPSSGSLFLFDRKVLRYFRKDGHNWRKKKDGKTVKEAHEKLKVGSIDVLHCYYAHGEESESFQRRSYWMLEPDLMHIVFVHYLEVKGNRTNIGGIKEAKEVLSNFRDGSSSRNTDSTSPTSTLTSLCEDADSGDSHQASSGNMGCPLPESPHMGCALTEKKDFDLLHSYLMQPSSGKQDSWATVPSIGHTSYVHGNSPVESGSQSADDLASWGGVFQHFSAGYHTVPTHGPTTSTQPTSSEIMLEHENMVKGELLAGNTLVKQDFGNPLPLQSTWQIPSGENSSKWPMDTVSNSGVLHDLDMRLYGQRAHENCLQNDIMLLGSHHDLQNEQFGQDNLQFLLRNAELQYMARSSLENDVTTEGNMNCALPVKKQLLDVDESLKKVDSFSRWVSKELGEVDDLQMQSSTGISWSTVDPGSVVDDSSLSPSLSQDQLFSIIDFTPKWAYTDSEIEVMIVGTFLKNQQEVTKCNWSCMFGEVEVPAEILVDGVLCCYAPSHIVGSVPFYVTCSNRLACSEVREFDYRIDSSRHVNIGDIYGASTSEMLFHMRLERLLSQRSFGTENQIYQGVREKRNLISKIILLKEEEESYQMPDSTSEKVDQRKAAERRLHILIKENLFSWLIHKVTEDGKGPSILDDEGQGVLHLAAAVGYDWAIKPILAAGVSINFRDVCGCTALHWAAFCGREQTVGILVSLGAAPGVLTDPSPEFPLGRTPADLASGNGHKGISGFLAESSLTSYLESLTMNDPQEDGTLEASGAKVVQTALERTATPVNDGDVADVLSLKDSLTAVCNATQAAHRIHRVFRMQSFQRKQLTEYGDDESGILDEYAISLIAAKARKSVQGHEQAHAAAVHIQKKFRGWKKRKEFLLIRQRIVKIQAHVRGHQVRKQYRAIVWSVGILEKVVLRWRRKGSGLRGFRRDALPKNPDPECIPPKEDDYDFLKEGRKQTEERLQKALTRVKSMVQYPEGRAQYRRLLTVVEEFRENKACDMAVNRTEETAEGDEDFIDIDSLLDDDTFMSLAFEGANVV